MTDNHNTSVDAMSYADRVRVAYLFKLELDRLQEIYDVHRDNAMRYPESLGVFLNHALQSMQRLKLLRLWISELHVLDKDVEEYKPE